MINVFVLGLEKIPNILISSDDLERKENIFCSFLRINVFAFAQKKLREPISFECVKEIGHFSKNEISFT